MQGGRIYQFREIRCSIRGDSSADAAAICNESKSYHRYKTPHLPDLQRLFVDTNRAPGADRPELKYRIDKENVVLYNCDHGHHNGHATNSTPFSGLSFAGTQHAGAAFRADQACVDH